MADYPLSSLVPTPVSQEVPVDDLTIDLKALTKAKGRSILTAKQ